MGFKFETANERWSWYKLSVDPSMNEIGQEQPIQPQPTNVVLYGGWFFEKNHNIRDQFSLLAYVYTEGKLDGMLGFDQLFVANNNVQDPVELENSAYSTAFINKPGVYGVTVINTNNNQQKIPAIAFIDGKDNKQYGSVLSADDQEFIKLWSERYNKRMSEQQRGRIMNNTEGPENDDPLSKLFI